MLCTLDCFGIYRLMVAVNSDPVLFMCFHKTHKRAFKHKCVSTAVLCRKLHVMTKSCVTHPHTHTHEHTQTRTHIQYTINRRLLRTFPSFIFMHSVYNWTH